MRVVKLCESFSPTSETFIYDTVVELERQCVDCHVLTMQRTNQEERPYEKVHLAPRPGRWNLSRLWYRALATIGLRGDVETHTWPILRSRFRRHLKRIAPDVLHAHFGPLGVLVAPVTEGLGIPLVVTFHGYDISVLPQRKQVRDKYRSLFKKSDALIGVSSHNFKKLKEIGAPDNKCHVIHNGTRISKFSYSNPARHFNGSTVRLLFVGRLVRVKSPMLLLESFLRAREKIPNRINLKLTIAGDGPLRETLEKKICNNEVSENVSCLGQISHTQVRRLMQTHHIYVQHCRKTDSGAEEGLGLTFIEAQASGLPVITTNSGGISDVVVDEETGYLVPEGDTEAMADRIAFLACHPPKWEAMGRAGRQHVEENFSLTRQVQELTEVYEQIIMHSPVAPD